MSGRGRHASDPHAADATAGIGGERGHVEARASVEAPAAVAEPEGRQLAREALAGSRRALARIITAIEDRTCAGEEALRLLHPLGGRGHLVGVTGPPGVGKSTLVAALTGRARETGRNVAVLAVDPSSPITGGALLGDRVRMQRHAGDAGVYIRSMAARGHPGGLAGATAEAAAVLDACGFGLVFLETVGTGQGEVDVASVADTTVVVQGPDAGDEVQAIKAGLLELADLVVVTRADRPGAERAAARLRAMLRGDAGQGLRSSREDKPREPEVLLASGTTGEGVAELLEALDRDAGERSAAQRGRRAAARLARARGQVEAILAERLRGRLRAEALAPLTETTIAAVAAHELDPYAAADRLMEVLGGGAEGRRSPRCR